MKKQLLTLFFLTVLCVCGFAQKVDDICGIYYMVDPFSKEGSQAEIYKVKEGVYNAKVVWVENPEKIKFLGLVFMTELTYNPEKKEYQNGVLKYPGKKGTYKTYMSLESATKLKVRGYWGIAVLGMTMYWTKEPKLREQKR